MTAAAKLALAAALTAWASAGLQPPVVAVAGVFVALALVIHGVTELGPES